MISISPNPQVHDFVQHWALHYEFIGKEGNNPLEFALRPVASFPVHPSYTNSKNRVPDQGKPSAGRFLFSEGSNSLGTL